MNILVAGINHKNAKHADADARWMSRYFKQQGHTVSLALTIVDLRYGLDIAHDVLWFSGEFLDYPASAPDIPCAAFDCCHMGSCVRTSYDEQYIWCAAKDKAWNYPLRGSVFAKAVRTWIKKFPESGPLLYATATGPKWSINAVEWVEARVAKSSYLLLRGAYGNQLPVCGTWKGN